MNDDERYSFDLQGFLVRRAVLTAAEVRAVNAEIDAQAYPPPDDTIAGQRFAGFLGSPSAPVATSLMDHSAVLDVVLEVNGPNARLDHSYGIHMAPGTSGLWVHGGGTPFDPAQYYERRSLFFKYSPGNSAYNAGLPVAADRLPSLSPQQQALCQVPSVAYHRSVFDVTGSQTPG